VRTVKTASGATAVQVVWSNKRGKKDLDHIGSAHTPEDLEVLKTVARQRMTAGQDELDLGDGRPRGRALTIQASRSEHLWNALSAGYGAVGLEQTCAGNEVFKQLVLARLIEPTSKLDSIRVLDEIGIKPRRIRRSSAGFLRMRRASGGAGSPEGSLSMPVRGRRRWFCMT